MVNERQSLGSRFGGKTREGFLVYQGHKIAD